MAFEEVAAVPAVEAAAQAVAPVLALCAAAAAAGPGPIAEGLETGLPDVPEIVFIDAALSERVAVDVGAGGDSAVDQDRGDIDAGVAEETVAAHPLLVWAHERLAAKSDPHPAACRALFGDKVHHLPQLARFEAHVGVAGRTPDRDDREQAPLPDADGLEHGPDLGQLAEVAAVDAGDHVRVQPWIRRHHADRTKGALEAAWAASHPVVGLLQAVQAHRQRAQPGPHQPLVHPLIVEPSVRDHSPSKPTVTDRTADLLDIRAQQRLAAGKDHYEVLRPLFRGDSVYSAEKVLERHILLPADYGTVAPAMTAGEVAAGRTLPEKIAQFVDLYLVVPEGSKQKTVHTYANLIN